VGDDAMMMKVAFFLLLLVNLTFFAWQSRHAEVTAPVSVEHAMVPRDVAPLRLVAERSAAGRGVSTSVTEPDGKNGLAPVLPGSVGDSCFVLGPLRDAGEIKRIVEELRTRGGNVTRRMTERREPSGYWVYLAPFESQQLAKDMLKELEGKGLNDLFIMGRGPMRNAISLGLFQRHSTAKERAQQLRALGYVPVTEVQYETSTEYLVDIVVPGSNSTVMSAVLEFASSLNSVEFMPRECD
jgi:hypothetical protein